MSSQVRRIEVNAGDAVLAQAVLYPTGVVHGAIYGRSTTYQQWSTLDGFLRWVGEVGNARSMHWIDRA